MMPAAIARMPSTMRTIMKNRDISGLLHGQPHTGQPNARRASPKEWPQSPGPFGARQGPAPGRVRCQEVRPREGSAAGTVRAAGPSSPCNWRGCPRRYQTGSEIPGWGRVGTTGSGMKRLPVTTPNLIGYAAAAFCGPAALAGSLTALVPGGWASTISLLPVELVHTTSCICPGYRWGSRHRYRTRTTFPVLAENSVNASSDLTGTL